MVAQSQPSVARAPISRADIEAEEPAAFSVSTALTNQRDSDGRIRSLSLVETWGSTDADGWSVEFVRSLNGLRVELRMTHPDGRRADYAFSLEPTLQAAIGLAVELANASPPPTPEDTKP